MRFWKPKTYIFLFMGMLCEIFCPVYVKCKLQISWYVQITVNGSIDPLSEISKNTEVNTL